MTPKIKNILIESFRGITRTSLALDGLNQVFRGDNGTGKSSIVDAIEFFFTGGLKSLQDTQGLSLRRHAPHVSSAPEDIKIAITFNPGNISLERTLIQEPKCPPQLRGYFETASKGTCILRRTQILEFITSKPADRFRAVSSIIGIEKLDDYELKLKHVSDSLASARDMLISKASVSRNAITTALNINEVSDDTILKAINQKLKELSLSNLESLDSIIEYSQSLIRRAKTSPEISRIQYFQTVKSASNVFTEENKEELLSQIRIVNNAIEKLVSEDQRKATVLADFLEKSVKILEIWDDSICPLCEQSIDDGVLLKNVEKRLKTVRLLSKEFSELKSACDAALSILNPLLYTLSRFSDKLAESEYFASNKKGIDSIVKALDDLKIRLGTVQDIKGLISIEALSVTFKQTKYECSAVSKLCDDIISKEKPTKREEQILEALNLLQTIKGATQELNKYIPEIANASKCATVASTLYNKFVSTKNSIIRSVFNVIQNDIEKYYQMLHSTDRHKNIKIVLLRRASIELKIDSFGQPEEDPRAYSSEGHLDSLGLCIFLAFVRKFNQDCSLIVLDDVVTTVDANHRKMICELLNNEFGDKQLLITTHEYLWFRQIKEYNIAHRVDSNYSYHDIRSWDLLNGPTIYPFKTYWEEIENKLKESDKTAGRDARIHLEWVCKQICLLTEAPLVYRDSDNYMIGELVPAVEARINKLLKECDFKSGLLMLITNLKATTAYGNILSHDNQLSDELTFAEVKPFCECVRNVYVKFTCPECGNMLKYYRELAILRCSNRKCSKPFETQTK